MNSPLLRSATKKLVKYLNGLFLFNFWLSSDLKELINDDMTFFAHMIFLYIGTKSKKIYT